MDQVRSNVFDALCFVLGRMSSKGLRADKLGNLVFNGGKHSKPAREAEVSIFLSNEKLENGERELLPADIDEVKITRVVSKTGASKYLLNNNKVTRTEIVEVLKRAHIDPDGYNIILQGDIMRIVNMSGVERRQLIEEISQVSGYEEKRQDALKKLDGVETNLKDADLLLNEKTKYLKELKSEKEHAEKFYSTKSQLQEKSLTLIKGKRIKNAKLIQQKIEEKEKQEEVVKVHQEKLDALTEKIKEIDSQLEEIEKTIEITSHGDFLEVTNSIVRLEEDIKNSKERKSELSKQQDDVKLRIDGLNSSVSKSQESITDLKAKQKKLEDEKAKVGIEVHKLNQELKSIKENMGGGQSQELESIEEEIEQLMERRTLKESQKQELLLQVERLSAKIDHIDESMNSQRSQLAENKDQVDELEKLQKELKTLILEISKTANQNSEYASKWGKLQQEIEGLQEKENKLREAKVSQSLAHASANKAVEEILKFKSRDENIVGAVSELATVDSKYSKAIDTIAGRALSHIVVEDDSTAVKYINYLKEKRIGSVTFLPLNKIKSRVDLDRGVLAKAGVVDYALNLVEFDRAYQKVFEMIFGETIVIQEISNAKSVGIGSYRMVSLDGDVVAKTGAMSGGFKSQHTRGGGFSDVRSKEDLEKVGSRIATLTNALAEVRGFRDESEKELYQLRERKMQVEGDVAKLEKILSVDTNSSKDLQRELEEVQGDKSILDGQLKKVTRDCDEIIQNIASLQEKRNGLRARSGGNSAIENLNKLEEQKEILQEQSMKLSQEIDTYSIQISNVLEPEIVNSKKIIEESKEANTRLGEQIKELETSIKEKSKQFDEFKKKEKELSKEYEGIIEKRDELKEKRAYQEKRYTNEYQRFEKVKEVSNKISYNLEEYRGLEGVLEEEESLLLSEIQADFVEHEQAKTIEEFISFVEGVVENIDDLKALQHKVNTLKSQLASFGSLNLKAVAVYDQIKEEFDALLERREKLNVEKDEILTFIAEMDEKKKIRFLETFNVLKDKFAETYAQLSSKGEAELLIENEKDVFNSGVEIKVKLSRKNYLDIKSLSGGEKTITAVAFIFAVQEFNPASFYVFDEIDAALDIMNCEKLGKLIKKNAHKAQYVVVSHSEYLIQSAEYIYGVTMDSNKVSGVVSLDLSNVKEYVDTEEGES